MRTAPFPYFTTSILRSDIQCRSVQGRTPRYCAASTTVSSCSADIRAFLTATSSVTAPERCRWTASRNRRVRGLSGLRDLEILGVRAVRLEHELAQAILGRWILD